MDRNSHMLIVSTQKITNRNHSDDSRTSHNILELCEDIRHTEEISLVLEIIILSILWLKTSKHPFCEDLCTLPYSFIFLNHIFIDIHTNACTFAWWDNVQRHTHKSFTWIVFMPSEWKCLTCFFVFTCTALISSTTPLHCNCFVLINRYSIMTSKKVVQSIAEGNIYKNLFHVCSI